jgi:hypothetical protein
MKISIPFAQTDAENPNVLDKTQSQQTEIYMKNIIVCFASLRKFNPNIKLQLITNKEVRIERILQKLEVELTYVPFTFDPPERIGKRFKGCFYIFDGILAMTESTLFIDPDVLCMHSLDTHFFNSLERAHKIGALDLYFPANKEVNGLTHLEAIANFSRVSGKQIQENFHVGGEAFFLPISLKKTFLNEVINYFNIAKLNPQDSFLPTEEHIFSVLLPLFKYSKMNHIVNRIWTSKSYRKIEGGSFEQGLPLWHLPAEKTRGFLDVYNLILEDKSNLDLDIFTDHKLILSKMRLNNKFLRNVQCYLFSIGKKLTKLQIRY